MPTNLLFVVINGNQFDLSWPPDHLGWRLQEQTNNLAAGVSTNSIDWDIVLNSAGTNHVVLPLDTNQPSQFFRLVYP